MSIGPREDAPDENTPLLPRRPSIHAISVQLGITQELKSGSYNKLSEDRITEIRIKPCKPLKKTVEVLEAITKKSFCEQIDDFSSDFYNKYSKKVFIFATLLSTCYVISKILQLGRNELNNWKTSLIPGGDTSCAVTYKNQASCTVVYDSSHPENDPNIQPAGVPPKDLFCFNLLVYLCTIEACGELLKIAPNEPFLADNCAGPTFMTGVIDSFAFIWPIMLVISCANSCIIAPIFRCFFGTYAQRTENRRERRRTQFFAEEPELLKEAKLEQYSNSDLGEILKEAKQALFFSQRHETIKEFFSAAGDDDTHLASIVEKYLGVHIKR